jgi:rhodanese-related sulfurtransferase
MRLDDVNLLIVIQEDSMGFFNRFKKKDNQPAAPAQAQPGTQSAGQAMRPERTQPEEEAPMPQVKELSVEELKAKLERGETPMIIDVREEWEYQIARLPQATLIPMNTIPSKLGELDKNAEIVVHCHHGGRSWNVAAYLQQNGFRNVRNLTGGIDAWARRVDNDVRTY